MSLHRLKNLLTVALVAVAIPGVAEENFHEDKLKNIDAAIERAMAQKRFPGAVYWLESNGRSYCKSYGHRAIMPAKENISDDTIFDAASLTKVIATTPAIMLLVERGTVKLDAPVKTYIREFSGQGRETVTVRQLLTHTSGLAPGFDPKLSWTGYNEAIRLACQQVPRQPVGTAIRYSDINFILLGEIVQRVSKKKLNDFVQTEIYQPLKMMDTGYLPPGNRLERIAPTERTLRGKAHDPTVQRMGGVAGHAGVFTTAPDLARFCRMLLNGGELQNVRLFKPQTVALMTSVQTPSTLTQKRALGWDIDTGFSRPRGSLFPIGSYGHTGFTGTTLWIDPSSSSFWILLSSRLHPTGAGNIMLLQREMGTLSAEAVETLTGKPFPRAEAAAN